MSPPLTGGGVTIDGDITGDCHPNVTLTACGHDAESYAFDVISSNNRLQALTLQSFDNGICA